MSSPSSSWEPPLPEELQRMLPQYEITGVLGRGGMGAVYKGRQAKLDRDVAIKLLPEIFSKGEDELNFAKRFEQEARAMAKLDHPAIISVFDFGETAEGQLYFVMEFIDGMDIHQYLNHHGGKLPQESALAITAHVLDALDYAHNHGIVHRDIKPANILLNHEGRVKIADFGLAKKFGVHADADAPALTMSNVAVGTPDFVAPEALDSDQTPDHRADLYAVGVMLYQMLTGKLPRGSFQLPNELNPEVDPRLDEIVTKATASHPDYRYASAAAMRADLDQVLSQPMAKVEAGERSGAVAAAVPVTASVKGGKTGKSGSKVPVYLGVGLAAVLVVGLVLLATRGDQEATTVTAGVSPGAPLPAPEVPEALPGQSSGQNGGRDARGPSGSVTDGTSKEDVTAVEEKAAPASLPVASEPKRELESPKSTVAMADAPVDPSVKETVAQASSPGAPLPGASADKTSESPADEGAPASEVSIARKTGDGAPGETPVLLDSLPGLRTRLEGYLTARGAQLTDLATKYGRGLDSRLNQAADSGDLKLTAAFDEEKARVDELVKTLAVPVVDPRAAVDQPVALPELPDASPESLVTLRQTWTTESEKILTTLDAALQQSLQALESELTRARDLERAKAVLAYRESLGGERSAGTPARSETSVTTETNDAGESARSPLPPATKDAPFENSLGMKFVPVPGTDLLFCIHETRYEDYEEYAKNAKESVEEQWKNQNHDGFEIKRDAEDHPVVYVSWEDAQKFCAWLSEKEGRTYRLPTDREWSMAVGIGKEEDWNRDTTPSNVFKPQDHFPWGKEWPPPPGSGNFSDESRNENTPRAAAQFLDGYDDGYPTTAPVMRFAPNELGLYDLGGNVWEWCEDRYSDQQEQLVLRGGSWRFGDRSILLSSRRLRSAPENRSNSHGFRLVLTVSSAR